MKYFRILALLFIILGPSIIKAQRYFTKAGTIYFNASGNSEIVEATNKSVTSVMDTQTGALQFSVMMKAFQFDKALMEEHFNENYVESSRFPKCEFKGEIQNNQQIQYNKEGSFQSIVKGKLTIHGITKDVEASGTISVKDGKIHALSEFKILLSDFNIEIPGLVKDKISNEVKIRVDCSMEILKG